MCSEVCKLGQVALLGDRGKLKIHDHASVPCNLNLVA